MSVEAGAVVRLRNRLWRIDQVRDDEFAATPIDGRDTRCWRFLRALEEPAVEPAALPAPDSAVLSDPAEQDLLLRAVGTERGGGGLEAALRLSAELRSKSQDLTKSGQIFRLQEAD